MRSTILGGVVLSLTIATLTTPAASGATAPKVNGSCTKAGATAAAGSQSLVCTKVGTKLQWKAAAATAPTAAPTTAPAATAAPTTAAEAVKAPSGEPIRVMQVLLELPAAGITLPETKAAVQGRIDRLNKEGGILGRPVKLEVCQAEFDPNKADDCARKAVDGKFIAVIGSLFASGDSWLKILGAAGIPSVGASVLTTGDNKFSNSYPVTGGGVATVAGEGAYLYDVVGARKIAMATTDSAAGQLAFTNIDYSLTARRTGLQGTLTVPRNKADLSAEAQRASTLGDSLALNATGGDFANMYRLLIGQGYSRKKIITTEGILIRTTRKAIGNDSLEGLAVISGIAPDDPTNAAYKAYLGDLRSIGPDLLTDAISKEAWLGTELFAQAAAKMKTADAKSFVAALTSITKFDGGGMIPPTDFSKPGNFLPDSPAVRNPFVQYSVMKAGEAVKTDGVWINPFAAK